MVKTLQKKVVVGLELCIVALLVVVIVVYAQVLFQRITANLDVKESEALSEQIDTTAQEQPVVYDSAIAEKRAQIQQSLDSSSVPTDEERNAVTESLKTQSSIATEERRAEIRKALAN